MNSEGAETRLLCSLLGSRGLSSVLSRASLSEGRKWHLKTPGYVLGSPFARTEDGEAPFNVSRWQSTVSPAQVGRTLKGMKWT